MNNYHKLNNIHQLFPAPGFRVFQCAIRDDGGTETVHFDQLPVIGWAVMRPIRDSEEISEPGAHWFSTNDEMVLYVFDGEGYPAAVNECEGGNWMSFILPPGHEITGELKTDWADQVRQHLASANATIKRRELICTLHDQGVARADIVKQVKSNSWEVNDALDKQWKRLEARKRSEARNGTAVEP